LYESTVLCEYLEEAYPSHTPRFLPSDPYDRARERIWTDYVTSRVIPAFHRFLQYQPSQDSTDWSGLEQRRQEFLGCLSTFAQEMDEQGPYFSGNKLSLVDLIMAPWAVRLWVFDHFKGGLGTPEPGQGGEKETIWARWRKWMEAIESLDSIRKTTSEREHYLPLYQRYADDVAQSELAKATRSGRGVP
jgi:glutathione S-transferase